MTKAEFLQDKSKLTVFLCGEIDHHGARYIRAQIDNQILKTMPKLVVMDFSHVTFMDSSGIAVILKTMRLVKEVGGVLVVENVPKQAMRVIDAAGIDRIISITALAKE